jgi:hypothetical protein
MLHLELKISVQLYEAPKKTSNFEKLRSELLSEPLATKYRASALETKLLCQDFNRETKVEMDIIKDATDMISNPKLLQYFSDLTKSAEDSGKRLLDSLKKADANLVDEELNKEGKECVEEVSDRVNKLKGGMGMGLVGELLTVLGQYSDLTNKSTTGGKINEMLNKKDSTLMPALLEKFSQQARKQIQLIDWVLQEADPTKQDTLELSALAAKSRSQIKPIEQAIRKLSSDPASVTTKELEQYNKTAKEIQSKLMSSNSLCQKNIFFNGASN